MKSGYFWDPALQDYFIPRGFAYQTFNPPVGASQTFEQLEYDLREFKKMHANSVRAEFVWSTVETAPGVFDWSKPDYLVAKAQELGLRLFVLIGFQYAPGWFPDDWKAMNDTNEVSVVLNYEHPQVRLVYSNFIYQVTARYRHSPTIGAWILGNEYAYFDLWSVDHRYLGFDRYSLDSYRRFLSAKYGGSIISLNATWGSNYAGFDAIPMFRQYPPDRNNPGYHDLILWREHSIGEYTAVGAAAAKRADPDHLRTYSMVGGLFIGNDANYTCEDAKTIVGRCAVADAPLDFWSINNYAWATFTAELRSTDSGIAKHIANSGLPVLVTETGQSTTDDLLEGAAERQAEAVPAAMWESLMSGAIGTHIFTWNDRNLFNGPFIREQGFGVVQQNRLPKAVYTNVLTMFLRMENTGLERLLPNSRRPPPDIAMFWSKAAEMGWPRANQENAMVWGALKRLGYQLTIVDDSGFAVDAYTNAPALLLSRCYQMNPADLDRIANKAVTLGLHLHANADLPGQYDAYHRPNPAWAAHMGALFGLNVSSAYPGWDSGVTHTEYVPLHLSGVSSLGMITNGYSANVLTWKIWHGLHASSGTTIATHTGKSGTQAAMPALQVKDLGPARTAVNTFALGDLWYQPTLPPMHDWDVRYAWLQAVYSNHFGLSPAIALSGTGAQYVLADYRLCSNGSLLISVFNEVTNAARVTLTATNLLAGRTIEDLTSGGILARTSDGTVTLDLPGDDFRILYAYPSSSGVDDSLLNPSPNKLWIISAPGAVWPTGSNYTLRLGYDLSDPNLTLMASFERVLAPNLVYSLTNAGLISDTGSLDISLMIPDPDLNDPWYISSLDGGDYVFHAWLLKAGALVAETRVPVRLAWAVRPLNVPAAVVPGASYDVTVEWQELPSWLSSEEGQPLDRARLWQSYLASRQYYKIVLQLRSAGQIVATREYLTNIGADRHTFNISVPGNATGPFTWTAYLETAPNASVDMIDSFEDRDTGTNSPPPIPPLFAPWQLWMYAENTNVQGNMYFDGGISTNASDGARAVFLVVTNPPTVGSYSGSPLVWFYPQPWALPHDISQWTNYSFSFDFKEASGSSCILEMQLKDARDGQIHFTNAYTPGPGGWFTIRASLDRFSSPPWVGHFDPDNVTQIVVNVQMQQTSLLYNSILDNISFTGLKSANQTIAPIDLWETFDNRPGGDDTNGWAALTPWAAYVWPGPATREWNRGIAESRGINGGQAAFMVVTNPPGVGDVSVFGLYSNFTNVWSLPADRASWTNYVFSYSFREETRRDCWLEMQVKSGANEWLEFRKRYSPGTDGWDTVRASLAEFQQPDGVGPFDPAHVQGIAVNIRMLQTGALYMGFLDNIFFDAPDTSAPAGARFGLYQSGDDSPREDASFSIQAIEVAPDGHVSLSWLAQTNRSYTVEYQDVDLAGGDLFVPLLPLTNLYRPANGLLTITDTNPPTSPVRFYRLRAQPR